MFKGSKRADRKGSERTTVCSGRFRSPPSVFWHYTDKTGFCFNYSKPSVPSFTSVDPIGLGSTGSFLVVPLTHNRTELSQTERVGSGVAGFQVKFEQTFERQ